MRPVGVCCISDTEVAVACREKNIQFVAIDGKIRVTRKIVVGHDCFGIVFNGGKLYVTNEGDKLYAYDLNGTCVKTISLNTDGNRMNSRSRIVSFNERGDRLFVKYDYKGLVCFDGKGKHVSTITDIDLYITMGSCFDGRGNMLVVGFYSHNVVQFDENGKKVGVLVQAEDELKYPVGLCFDKPLNRLYVIILMVMVSGEASM